ncbi:MAG: hypothetical protein JWP36_2238 [Paucimonas sp.]|nr:hypothetical protein [Paucimonas sp.]
MIKWVLPLACVVALSACGQMQQDRARSSSTGSMGASSTSSTGSSGSSMTSGSVANPNANPAAANPQPGEVGAKEKGSNPAVKEPTTSGTTTK